MPIQLDRTEIKSEARSLIRTGTVSPIRMTLLLLVINLVLSLVNSGVSYMVGESFRLASIPFSFISILVSLVSLVLNAGYTCYCLGIHRRDQMPYESLFDAFSFAGKVILLSIVEGVFIFLWSLLFVIPGIVAAYHYSFAIMNLCRDPDLGVMEALNLSKQQTFGYKWQLFLLQFSFIGWYLLAGAITALYELLIVSLLPDNFLGIMFGTAIFTMLSAVVEVYLTPYTNLAICGFYLRAAAPQGNKPPHFDFQNGSF